MVHDDVIIKKGRKTSSCACIMILDVWSSLYSKIDLLFHFVLSVYWLVSCSMIILNYFLNSHFGLLVQIPYHIGLTRKYYWNV